jgi:thioredoxin reductase/bacterioferritin-associated ferredoxin
MADAGISVVLVDENSELGGQYYRQRSPYLREQVGDFRKRGTKLIDRLKNTDVVIVSSSFLFAVDDTEKAFYVFKEKANKVLKIDCNYVIVATGSQEMVIPYLGWETPKCITPGMASRIFDIDYIPANNSIVIAGSGPFLLAVAANLVKHGVNVKSVIEYHKPYQPKFMSLLIVFFPTRLLEFIDFRFTLWRAKVPVISRCQVVEAKTSISGINSRFISLKDGSEIKFESDYLAISYGFSPTVELSALLDVDIETNSHFRTTKVSSSGETNKDWVYVVGESVDIQGWRSASARGELAALSILEKLQIRKMRHRLSKLQLKLSAKYEEVFSVIRKSVFSENQPFNLVTHDDLLICRCENVTYQQVVKYIDQPWSSASGLKAETRVGMGTCQGKQCGYALGRVCAELLGNSHAVFTNTRIPLRPVPVSALIELPDRTKLAKHT